MTATTLAATVAIAPAARRPRAHALSVLARIAWADVLERTRRPGFLLAVLAMMWLAHGMLPPQGAGYRTFVINETFRPAYGPAWVGTLVALLTGLYFLLVGFYLVRGSVQHDRHTGVGQILAAARVGRVEYVLARWVGNLLVLGAFALAAAGVALATQLLLGEDRRVDLIAVLWPFLWLTLPVASFTAAGAVLWDCTPGLRGGFGNVAWFFFFCSIVSVSAIDDGSRSPFADLAGGRVVARSVAPVLRAAFPESEATKRSLSMGVNVNTRWRGQRMRTFDWRGLSLTAEHVASRAWWLLVGLGMALLAAVPFDRFQSVGHSLRLPRLRFAWPSRGTAPPAAALGASAVHLAPARRSFRFGALLRAELVLMLRGQPAWWWLAVVGMGIAQLAAPLAAVRTALMPIAAFLPVFVWSALGHRERRSGTAGILFCAARAEWRLLLASFAAAALVFVVVGVPGLARLAMAGDGAALAGWAAGALCVAGFALALGEWSGNARLFEVAYLFVWYVGPMHRVPGLDVTGVTAARSPWTSAAFAAAGLAALLVAWVGRRRPVTR